MDFELPFRRYRAVVQRQLDRWPLPGTLLVGVPELGSASRLFVCPRCSHKWPFEESDRLEGPDEAPTLHGEPVCAACGAHYRIENGRIIPLPDIRLQRKSL